MAENADERRARGLYERHLFGSFDPTDPVADAINTAIMEAIRGEREACAKLCDDGYSFVRDSLAAAIRARASRNDGA